MQGIMQDRVTGLSMSFL